MDNPQPTRRFRLHSSTWVVGGIALLLGLLVVVPGSGEVNKDWAEMGPSGATPVKFEHGWPCRFLTREFVHMSEPLPKVPWLFSDAWEVWQSDYGFEFQPWYLVLDLIVLVIVVVFCSTAWEWRSRRRNRLLQFNVADLLMLCLFLALPLGWYHSSRVQVAREEYHDDQLRKQFEQSFYCYWVDEAIVPVWLERLIGRDRLQEGKYVSDIGYDPTRTISGQRLEQALPHLRRFKQMTSMNLSLPSSGEELFFQSLSQLPQLRELKLNDDWYEDSIDMQLAKQIVRLQQLTSLEIDHDDEVQPEIAHYITERMPRCKVEFSTYE